MEPEVEMFARPSVVLQIGSHTTKAGFSSDNFPVVMFRTLVARPKDLHPPPYGRPGYEYDVFIGDEAVAWAADMELTSPIEFGKVVQWDNLERLCHHILYKEVKVAPEHRSVIILTAPDTSLDEKAKLCDMFFNNLNVPGLCIQPVPTTAVYGTCLTTGVVVDLGFDSTNINPVYEGTLMKFAHVRSPYAGRAVSEYFQEAFAKKGIHMGYDAQFLIDNHVMNEIYVTENCAMSRKDCKRTVRLISGQVVDVTNEAFLAGEMFFQPELILGAGCPYKSLAELVSTAIRRTDRDMFKEMCSKVIMTGGLSSIPGLANRLEKEMKEILKTNIKIYSYDESGVSYWMGASSFAYALPARTMWVSKKQYEDYGMKIIRNKFL